MINLTHNIKIGNNSFYKLEFKWRVICLLIYYVLIYYYALYTYIYIIFIDIIVYIVSKKSDITLSFEREKKLSIIISDRF